MSTLHRVVEPGPAAARRLPERPWWDLSDASWPTLRDVRTRRVMLMVVLIWIVGVFDFVFTVMAVRIGGFEEANPLARQFIHSPLMLAVFKFSTLSVATAVLVAFSRRRLTEFGCWFLAAAYAALAVVWLVYYGLRPAG